MKRQIDLLDIARCAECVCLNFRKVTRAITQIYDEILQPSGLRVTQFTLLAAIAGKEPLTVSRLASMLIIDRTTLTRNLKLLENQGFVAIEPGKDMRTRMVTLTDEGRQALSEALPLWEKAQAHVVEKLGRKRWDSLRADLSEIATLVRSA